MSWSGWGTRLNVTSIVSQGLEQVSKLREDVEKQFDQVVTGVNVPYARGNNSSSAASDGQNASSSDQAASSTDAALPPLPPPIVRTSSVDDIGVTKPSAWGKDVLATLRQQQQPPHSADGKRRPGALPTDPPLLFAEEKAKPQKPDALEESTVSADDKHDDAPSPVAATNEKIEEKSIMSDEEEKPMAIVSDVSAVVTSGGDADSVVDQPDADGVADQPDADTIDDVKARNEEDEADDVPEVNQVPGAESTIDSSPGADSEVAASTESNPSEGDEVVEAVDTDEDGQLDEEHQLSNGSASASASASEDEGGDATVTSEADTLVLSLKKELALREAQLLATSSTITELHNELDKTCQREVVAVDRARTLADQLEQMRAEMDRQASAAPRASELQTLQYELEEKDAQLKALLEEGNALSVKQAQYEQRLRSLRKEKDEEEERRLKFQTSSEALTVEIRDLTAKVKSSEEENQKLAKQLKELENSSQSSVKKLSKAEEDAKSTATKLGQAEELVKTLTADNQAMKAQLEELKGTTQSHEVLTVEKQEMQRAIEYLQHSVHELEKELARREETARTEMQAMKKKWLDAVGRVDLMGQSVSDATQPLLQQIQALQEEHHTRQETWRATEAALLARLEDADKVRQALETEKFVAEQKHNDLQVKMNVTEDELAQKHTEFESETEKNEKLQIQERELRGQLDSIQVELEEVKLRLNEESEAKHQLLSRINADRLKKPVVTERVESTEDDNAANELSEAREREQQLRDDLERVKSELAEMKLEAQGNGGAHESAAPRSSRGVSLASDDGKDSAMSQASILKNTLESPMDSTLMGGNTTVLGLSQLQQRLRLAEGEKRMLKQQLALLEAKQKQNTDEIVRLSTRNALLETKEAELHQSQHNLAELKQRQQVLLELFGEKEEQVEELQAEVGELKAFYRKQLDTLAGGQQ